MALFESLQEKSSLRVVVIAAWIVVAGGVLVTKYGRFWSEGEMRIVEATAQGPSTENLRSSIPDVRTESPASRDVQDGLRAASEAPPAGPDPDTEDQARDGGDISEEAPDGSDPGDEVRALAEMPWSEPGPDQDPVDYFRSLLKEDPGNPTALFELGRNLEASGRFADAISSYQRLLEVRGDSAPELLLRLGRLHRWTDRPAEALFWYERHRDREISSDSMAGIAAIEHAEALLDADRPEESLRLILSTTGPSCASVNRSVLAARAANAAGEVDSAIRALECLRGSDAFTPEHRMWLAGLYWQSGSPEAALAAYEAVLSDSASGPRRIEALRAVGNLRLQLGDPSGALDAYASLPEGPDRALLRARARRAGGQLDAAVPLFESYVEARPEDADARLSLARLYASLRRPEPAIREYRAVLRVDSSLVGEVELARAFMGAGEFQDAAEWAERAMKAEEEYWEAGLTLAAAYRFMGRRHEADRLFTMLNARPLAEPESDLWQGRVSLARGMNLDAWIELEGFVKATGDVAGNAALLQARASVGRQDAGRGRTALERARRIHGDSVGVAATQVQLDSLTRPAVSLPVTYTSDANGLSRRTEAVDAALWPWSSARIRGKFGNVSLDQESVRTSTLSFGLAADRFFPSPNLEVGGSIELDKIKFGPLSYSGDLWGRWSFRDGSEVGLSLSRDLLWNSGPSLDRQEPTRIVELDGVGASPYVEALRLNARKNISEHGHLLADGGRVTYADGNAQHFLYGQLQIPLESEVGKWTVLTPRIYGESFQRSVPEYFSPRGYLSGGVGGHTIRDLGAWNLEAELVPQMFWTRDDAGLALRGLLKTTFSVGSVRPEVGGYAYLQDDDYHVYQAFARISVPLGGTN